MVHTAPRPYPKLKSLHYNEAVQRYFAQMERDGHDMKNWMYVLRSPGGLPPSTMIRLAEYLGTDIGELLRNGIGRNNTYDAVDEAVRANYTGHCLGPVELLD